MKTRLSSPSKLRITEIHIYRLVLPRKDPFRISSMSLDKVENVLIEMRTNEGITGWGEASPYHSLVGETLEMDLAAAQEMKALLLEKNPLHIDACVKTMEQWLPHNPTIKSAFDMALFDIASQVAGLPLYMFLGGQYREIETDFTIGIETVERTLEKVEKVLAEGFRIIKIKVGHDDQEDFLRLQELRKQFGENLILRLDANQAWHRIQALQNLKKMTGFHIEFCEQPCPADDLPSLKYLSDHSPIPIMADESLFSPADALQLVLQDAAPYFNIKLSKSGGIHRAQKIVHIAETAHRVCMVGCMSESRLGLTASVHLALSSGVFQFFDLDSFFEHGEDPMIGGLQVKNGMVQLPEAPGLGVHPDPAFVKKLEEVG